MYQERWYDKLLMPSDTHETVAVVDDEPQICSLYAEWLEPRFAVRQATGGAQALRVIDDSVDVILLDRRMNDFTGDEVLQRLRYRGCEAMVALTTAVEPSMDVINLPFDEYLTKPNTREEVETTVKTLLRRAEYDHRRKRCFSMASKVAALTTNLDEESLSSSSDFKRLQDRLEEALEDADETLDWLIDNHALDRAYIDV